MNGFEKSLKHSHSSSKYTQQMETYLKSCMEDTPIEDFENLQKAIMRCAMECAENHLDACKKTETITQTYMNRQYFWWKR